jgi:hypothetical protein
MLNQKRFRRNGKKYITLFSLKTKKVNIYGFKMTTEGVKHHL